MLHFAKRIFKEYAAVGPDPLNNKDTVQNYLLPTLNIEIIPKYKFQTLASNEAMLPIPREGL